MEPAPDAALDWQASPWVGPSVRPDPGDVPVDAGGGPSGIADRPDSRTSRGAASGDGGRAGGRRRAAAAVQPHDDGDASDEYGKTGSPAASPRRRAPGGVGRRTVSRRGPRDLLPDDDAAEVARQVCLDQLSHTARTRAELATALDHRGVPADVTVQVLDRFTEVGLIDDAAFAEAWVARRSAAKGLSGRALAQELRRRGIADDVAGTALAAIDPDDEVRAARDLVERKLRSTTSLAPDARLRRLVAMLGRKGHGPGMAYRVVREALAGEGLQDPDDDGPDRELD